MIAYPDGKLATGSLALHNLLADTGADFTTLPRFLGEQLIADIERGEPQWVIGPQMSIPFYLHILRAVGHN